jgi:hypothetical protein
LQIEEPPPLGPFDDVEYAAVTVTRVNFTRSEGIEAVWFYSRAKEVSAGCPRSRPKQRCHEPAGFGFDTRRGADTETRGCIW